jgi:hypothetical protein
LSHSEKPEEQKQKATKRGLWAAVETAPARLVASSRRTESSVTPIMSRVHKKMICALLLLVITMKEV